MVAIFVGSTIRIDGTFTQLDDDGVAQPYDPSPAPELRLYHRVSATEIEGTVVRDGEGFYHADVVVDEPGLWSYRWEVGGAQPAAQEGGFKVEYSGVPVS